MSEEFVNMANLIDKSKVEVIETEPKEPASGADAASQADAAKAEEQRLAEDKAKADKAAADAAQKSEPKSETTPDLSKIAGGKFKTINELETRITELEDYAKTREELAQLRKLKEQHEELVSSYSQFEDMDEVTGKLAILKKKDPEKGKVFERILNSDDSISVLKECLKHNNPRYKNDPKLLEARIKKDYGILFDPEVEQDSDEYLIAKDELETRAEEKKAKALKSLIPLSYPRNSQRKKRRPSKLR